MIEEKSVNKLSDDLDEWGWWWLTEEDEKEQKVKKGVGGRCDVCDSLSEDVVLCEICGSWACEECRDPEENICINCQMADEFLEEHELEIAREYQELLDQRIVDTWYEMYERNMKEEKKEKQSHNLSEEILPEESACGSSPNDEEESLHKIAKHVYDWYIEWLENNVEPEADVMKTVDLEKVEGRFELLILARLFNNRLKEKTAIRYFQRLKEWFHNKDFSYQVGDKTVGKIDLRVIEDTNHKLHQEFRDLIFNEFIEMNLETRGRNYIGFVTCARKFHEKDLKYYIDEVNNDKDILDIICEKLRTAGIFVKSFWIVREMYKAGVWKIDRENLWMCCVPDSKVRGYLNDMSFVPKSIRIERGQIRYSLSQLKDYSKIIWKYFNEPFDMPYFDLPIFRYLKEADEISLEEFERLKRVD